MKLILTQEVTGLGGPGEIVEVKDGYGRNYLLPQGKAIVATRGAEKQVAQIQRARQQREIRDLGTATEVANQLRSLTVPVHTRAGEGGRLFGSVTPTDIVDAVVAAGGPKLDKRRIELRTPIKNTGTHQVHVRLHPEVTATISLSVVGTH
jgi:large subunit ribosomal protein L9